MVIPTYAHYFAVVCSTVLTYKQHDQDMMAALINQTYRDGRPLRDHEIAHIMIALLMAGQHTSSATGSWSLLHVASRPDIAYVLLFVFASSVNI